MNQSTTPSLSQTFCPRWASTHFLSLPIVQTLLSVTLGYSLSSEAVIIRQLWRYVPIYTYTYTHTHTHTHIYIYIYIYTNIYIYICRILSPVKPELGVIPSGQENIREYLDLPGKELNVSIIQSNIFIKKKQRNQSQRIINLFQSCYAFLMRNRIEIMRNRIEINL